MNVAGGQVTSGFLSRVGGVGATLLAQVGGVGKWSAGAAALVSKPSSRRHGTVIPTKSLNNLAQSLQVRSEWSVNNGVFME